MRAAFFLFIVGVVTSIDVGYAASADSADYSARRIALSFDDAPKGAGPKFGGDERASVLLAVLESLIQSLAVDADLDPRTLTHLAIEETQIDALLVERGVFGGME